MPATTPSALRDALKGRKTLESLRAAVAELPGAVLIADRHGRFVATNEAASRLTGFSVAELLRMALPDLTAEADAPVFEVLWRGFLDQGRQTGDFAIRHRDGKTVTVHYEAVANIIPGYHASFLTRRRAPASRPGAPRARRR